VTFAGHPHSAEPPGSPHQSLPIILCGSFRLRSSFAHNVDMPFRKIAGVVLAQLLLFTLAGNLNAKNPPVPALGADYLSALATADRLLQAWQAGDVESGMSLLSQHAKERAGAEAVQRFFSTSSPLAYEIGRGKPVKGGRYEFPVVLMEQNAAHRVRRRFSSIVIAITGNADCAVDKLP